MPFYHFSVSILIFQISCKKEANADSPTPAYTLKPATKAVLGGVKVGDGLNVTDDGTVSVVPKENPAPVQLNKILFITNSSLDPSFEGLYLANYDGSQATEVHIQLPIGADDIISTPRISPDMKRIFFSLHRHLDNHSGIYSCKLDGSDVKRLTNGSGGEHYEIGGVY